VIIDFHAHVGSGHFKSLSVRQLIRLMDSNGVDRAVLCPVDKYIAVYNRLGNDLLLRTIRAHSDRFQGLAVANPWVGRKACEELRRALDAGLAGLKVHSPLQGFMLCDPLIDPLLEIAREYRVPVYAHTGTMNNALPFQLLELAKRFPEIQFVMGHAAFSDFWMDVVPVLKQGSNILVETSHASPDFIENIIREVGATRVVFGSDVPESEYPLEIKKLLMFSLDDSEKEAVFASNAMRLCPPR
jgi:predicted TIM-barrel fold metal-dependent hydrolase